MPSNKPRDSYEENEQKTLEIARVILCRRLKDGYEVLLCENLDKKKIEAGKGSQKNGKYEFPGGKIFSDASQQSDFLRLDDIGREELGRETASREVEEETGFYISPKRLELLGKSMHMFEQGDTYQKGGLDCTAIQTHYYVAYLDEGEYRTQQADTVYAAQDHNDDQHTKISWEKIDSLDGLKSLGGVDVFSQSSNIPDELCEQIAGKIQVILEKQDEKWTEIAGAHPFVSTDFGKVSLLDIVPQDITFEQFSSYFELHVGKKLDTDNIPYVRDILQTHVVPHITSRISTIDERFGYRNGIKRKKLADILNRQIISIKTPEDIYHFFKKGITTRIGRQVLRYFIGYAKFSQLPYFPYIDGGFASFQENLQTMLQSKTSSMTSFSGDKIELEFFTNRKERERIASKITTKPENTPEDIKDVLRARFIVENTNEIGAIRTVLLRKFGGIKSQKKDSWRLQDDTDDGSNIGAGERYGEKKLLGLFPYFIEKDGKEHKIDIPLEIQLISKDDYYKTETGVFHHDIYVEIQNFVDEARGNEGISASKFEGRIEALSDIRNAYMSYQDASTTKENTLKSRLKNDIRERLKLYFFKANDTKYYSFAHMYRTQDVGGVVRNHDSVFQDMTHELNNRLSLRFTSLEWKKILYKQWDNEIMALFFSQIGVGIFDFLNNLNAIKWKYKILFSDFSQQYRKYIEEKNKSHGIENLESLLLIASEKGISGLRENQQVVLKGLKGLKVI